MESVPVDSMEGRIGSLEKAVESVEPSANEESTPVVLEERVSSLESLIPTLVSRLSIVENQNLVLMEAVSNLSRAVSQLKEQAKHDRAGMASPLRSSSALGLQPNNSSNNKTPARQPRAARNASVAKSAEANNNSDEPASPVASSPSPSFPSSSRLARSTSMHSAASAALAVSSSASSSSAPSTPVASSFAATPSRMPAITPRKDPKERFEGVRCPSFLKSALYYPSNVSDSLDALKKRSAQAPSASLQLQHVYGYTSTKSKGQNIFVLPTGQYVWFAAAVAVIFDPSTKTQRCYANHDDDISCMAQAADGFTFATSQTGRGPKICVWDARTLETIAVLNDLSQPRSAWAHTSGVSTICFSNSSELIATAGEDLEHTLVVYEWKKNMIRGLTKSGPNRTYGLSFSADDSVLALASFKLFKLFTLAPNPSAAKSLPNLQFNVKSGLVGNDRINATMQSVIFCNGFFVTGTKEGEILVWNDNRIIAAAKAHEGGVISMALLPSGTGFVSGGKDGSLKCWTMTRIPSSESSEAGVVLTAENGPIELGRNSAVRSVQPIPNGDYIVGFFNGEIALVRQAAAAADASAGSADVQIIATSPSSEGELWALACDPHRDLLLAGNDEGTILEYDYIEYKLVRRLHSRKDKTQIRCLDISPDGKQVAFGTATGSLYVIDRESGEEIVALEKAGAEKFSVVRYSPDGKYLAAANNDQYIHVFNAQNKYSRVGQCKGHSSYVVNIDFSVDGKKLVSNDGAYEILYWDVESCKQIRGTAEFKDTEWASYTRNLGWSMQGVWQEGMDGTDINAALCSPKLGLAFTCDDMCKINLFNWPSVSEKAAHHEYLGHSSHVTNVVLTRDSRFLLTAGGADLSLLQWRIQAEAPASPSAAASSSA